MIRNGYEMGMNFHVMSLQLLVTMNKNQGRRISRNGKRQLKGDLEIDKMVQCCFRDGYKILAR